ncbi:MAG: LacI family DNA-binding transcriptional regulator [Anaerolineae bacterium]|nr:MAG: LacI family DNA-binding transcriptional regulator [Anaerolineae bacterium]
MATIREVAQKAGVSIGTVSRALNHKPGVSNKTRQHIFTVAQELGYALFVHSPSPPPRITHLGLLSRPMGSGPLTANPFYGDVFHAVEKICHEFHISLSFCTLNIVRGRSSLFAGVGR